MEVIKKSIKAVALVLVMGSVASAGVKLSEEFYEDLINSKTEALEAIKKSPDIRAALVHEGLTGIKLSTQLTLRHLESHQGQPTFYKELFRSVESGATAVAARDNSSILNVLDFLPTNGLVKVFLSASASESEVYMKEIVKVYAEIAPLNQRIAEIYYRQKIKDVRSESYREFERHDRYISPKSRERFLESRIAEIEKELAENPLVGDFRSFHFLNDLLLDLNILKSEISTKLLSLLQRTTAVRDSEGLKVIERKIEAR